MKPVGSTAIFLNANLLESRLKIKNKKIPAIASSCILMEKIYEIKLRGAEIDEFASALAPLGSGPIDYAVIS
jgi:hypothetical protein